MADSRKSPVQLGEKARRLALETAERELKTERGTRPPEAICSPEHSKGGGEKHDLGFINAHNAAVHELRIRNAEARVERLSGSGA